MNRENRALKNHFTRNLCFSILEILSLNPVTIVCGIVACVFTAKSNTSYLDGRMKDYEAQERGARIALISGLIIFLIVLASVGRIALVDWQVRRQVKEQIKSEEQKERKERIPLEETKLAGYYTFTLEGRTITLPMEYEEFEKLGFGTMDEEHINTYFVNPDDSAYGTIVSNDELIGDFFVYNRSQEAKPIRECTVERIRIRGNGLYRPQAEFGPGFTLDSGKDEVVDYYGTPDDGYFPEDDPQYGRFQWHAPDYRDNRVDLLEVVFDGGQIIEVNIAYCGGASR